MRICIQPPVRPLSFFLIAFAFLCPCSRASFAQDTHASLQLDSDRDGLSDALEQALLVQFAPAFMVGQKDCAHLPAEFQPEANQPVLKADNGTIYGQVFPARTSTAEKPLVEIHFYHLWDQDCGAHGHPLDTEHVAALVQPSSNDLLHARWKALYWYAAAHENTVCDVSQIARASTLKAEDQGAEVWISPDKHASYLNENLCQGGCGADRCKDMVPLHQARLINLGEIDHPMNGSTFIMSSRWPLAGKMSASNFPADSIARLEQMPESEIAWFNAGRHPVQGVIAVSSSTEDALATSGHNTTAAISVADESTGDALQKSYRNTVHALGTSARHVGDALHVTPKSEAPE